MKPSSREVKDYPLNIVGSSTFGRYPKISLEQTWNMFVSDGWLVSFPGYSNVNTVESQGSGRGMYVSTRLNKLILVIDNNIYLIDNNLNATKLAEIATYTGDVFISENNVDQIAFCDKQSIYIYNYQTNTFQQATTDFIPGHISFQDGYFIAASLGQAKWRLSDFNNGLIWPAGSGNVGLFQTKPDNVVATAKVPGKGNLLLVFGNTVTEAWHDIGLSLFPYQRNSYMNIDYGCLNPATIASNDRMVVWLAANERSGAVIMYTEGGEPKQISTDGINYRFSNLNHPELSSAFLYKIDGHVFYQITFYHEDDNITFVYDFNTEKFFSLCDPNMNYHIAKSLAFFEGEYYFISFNDGNLYDFSSLITTANGKAIPRIRICQSLRMKDASPFVAKYTTFTAEQGQFEESARVDMSFSIDGGQSFGASKGIVMNSFAQRKNRLIWWNMGRCNEMIHQFRFWGFNRFVAYDGVTGVYQ